LIVLRESAFAIDKEESLIDALVSARSLLLPSSQYYTRICELSEIPSACSILMGIADLLDKFEDEKWKSEVDKRKKRLGADTLANIKLKVTKEVLQASKVWVLANG
jgi:hypothetical protein